MRRVHVPKGQLILKWLVGILNSSRKQTKKVDLQYYDSDAGTGGTRAATSPPNILQIS